MRQNRFLSASFALNVLAFEAFAQPAVPPPPLPPVAPAPAAETVAPLPPTAEVQPPSATPPAPEPPRTAAPPETLNTEITPNPPQVPGAPAALGDETQNDGDAETGKKKKKKKEDRRANLFGEEERYGRLEIGGRVFARVGFSSRELGDSSVESLDLSVQSARVDFSYQAPAKWLSVDIEFDVAGNNPEMKDAFVQAKGRHFFARAGQFKPPVSAIEMESPWVLPLADRGFLNDLLLDYLDVAGRRPGVLLGWRGRGGIKPRISVGAFQGSTLEDPNVVPGDRDVELIEERDMEAVGFAARFDVEIDDVGIGVFYQHRVGSPLFPETNHYPTGGADLVWDQTLDAGGVRLWADFITGTSWYEYMGKTADEEDAVFLSGRVLGAYRFGGTEDEAFYVEPFGMLGLLEPDVDISKDFALEGVIGLNVGLWRRGRLALQGEINQADENFPNHSSGYLFGLSPDRVGLTLQVGVAF
jgi:hypothetical protein